MTNEIQERPDALHIQEQLNALQIDKVAACNAYYSQWFKPEIWQHKNGKMVAPIQLTPEGERVMAGLAAPLRALERQIAELQSQMPPASAAQ